MLKEFEEVNGEGSPSMSVEDHIESLKKKHADLDLALEDENSRPMPNTAAIKDLKRQKLAIKDEIARLSRD